MRLNSDENLPVYLILEPGKFVIKFVHKDSQERDNHMLCQHKYVIPILDSFVHQDIIYLKMPYARHANLSFASDLFVDAAPVKIHQFLFRLLLAVYYIHSHYILHDDIHPGNILVTSMNQAEDFYPQICDFGNSKRLTEQHYCYCKLGVSFYVAPEKERNAGHSFPSDIYSLGQVFAYVLNHCIEPKIPRNTPLQLKQIIRQMTSESPDRRPTSLTLVNSPIWAALLTQEFVESEKLDSQNGPPIQISRHDEEHAAT